MNINYISIFLKENTKNKASFEDDKIFIDIWYMETNEKKEILENLRNKLIDYFGNKFSEIKTKINTFKIGTKIKENKIFYFEIMEESFYKDLENFIKKRFEETQEEWHLKILRRIEGEDCQSDYYEIDTYFFDTELEANLFAKNFDNDEIISISRIKNIDLKL